MRILHVLNSTDLENGGTVQAVRELSAHQAALGHEVTIASVGKTGSPASSRGEQWSVFPVQWAAWKWSHPFQSALPEMIRAADIVHLHTMWEFPVYFAHVLCLKFGKSYVLSPHGMLEHWSLRQQRLKKRIYLLLAGRAVIVGAKVVIFTSDSESVNSQPAIGDAPAVIAPLGVTLPDEKIICEDLFYRRFPQLVGKPFLLFLGRLHYKKQPELVLRAFKRIAADFKDVHLLMAGPGEPEYVSQLKKIFEKEPIEKRILFSGALDRPLVFTAYQKAHLFLLPSLQENFGLSVAEAMASGCPVLVSPQVSLSEEIAKADAGMVIAPDEETLARSILRLLSDADLRKRMGESGRRMIHEKFTWNKVVLRYIEVYENVLK